MATWLCILQVFAPLLLRGEAITWLPQGVVSRPSPAQLEWHSWGVGVMITWNLQSACLPTKGPANIQPCDQGGWLYDYSELESWAPYVDTEEWLNVSASFGAKYAVLVADHFSGFTLWPSQVNNATMAHTAAPLDVVGAFGASCVAKGIAPGFFYSVHDNWVYGMDNFAMGNRRAFGGPPLTAAEYEAAASAQLRELLAYPTSEIWFDAGVNFTLTPHVGALVAELAPNTVCHSCAGFTERGGPNVSGAGVGLRWMGNEEAVMPLPNWGAVGAELQPYTGDPVGAIYAPASCDTVLSEHYWFNQRNFNPSYDDKIRSTCNLVNAYLTSWGRGCNLILNLAPDWNGTISRASAAAYAAFGTAISCLWSSPIASVFNLTLFNSAAPSPADNGTAVWTLDVPFTGTPCSHGGSCFNLSLHLTEFMASAGQRIASWSVDGCFSVSCAEKDWVPLTAQLPATATVAIGARRVVALNVVAPAGASLSELRLTAVSAYPWAGTDGAPAGRAPIVLASVSLFNWAAVQSCVLGNCDLPKY